MDGQVTKNDFLYRFSIVIPTYNVEKYVQSCLTSVINQTFLDMEIIIVNDGSTDSSIRIIENYIADKTIPIKILTQNNAGLSAARNTGFKAVKGEYVMFLDSDDSLELNALELLDQAIRSYPTEEFDYVCFTRKNISETGIESDTEIVNYTFAENDKILNRQAVNRDALCFENVSCSVIDKIFKSSFLLGFVSDNIFVPGRYYEDHLFMMDALLKTNKVLVTKHKIYRYLIREGSIMRTANIKIAEDYHFLINNLWNKRTDFYIDPECLEQICINHVLVQTITFFQTLRNSNVTNNCDYSRIVRRFKELMSKDKLDIILLSKFSSAPKNLLARYFKSTFSNYLKFNNLVFSVYDLMMRVKKAGN